MAPQNSKSRKPAVGPDPNRLQTRPKNATAHLGKVLIAQRRRPEDIEDEKRQKAERRQAQDQKKVDIQAAVQDVAKYEDQMAIADAEAEAKFPRRKPKGELIEQEIWQ